MFSFCKHLWLKLAAQNRQVVAAPHGEIAQFRSNVAKSQVLGGRSLESGFWLHGWSRSARFVRRRSRTRSVRDMHLPLDVRCSDEAITWQTRTPSPNARLRGCCTPRLMVALEDCAEFYFVFVKQTKVGQVGPHFGQIKIKAEFT